MDDQDDMIKTPKSDDQVGGIGEGKIHTSGTISSQYQTCEQCAPPVGQDC